MNHSKFKIGQKVFLFLLGKALPASSAFIFTNLLSKRGRVVKSAMIMIEKVFVENLLLPFCCILSKRHFTVLSCILHTSRKRILETERCGGELHVYIVATPD